MNKKLNIYDHRFKEKIQLNTSDGVVIIKRSVQLVIKSQFYFNYKRIN